MRSEGGLMFGKIMIEHQSNVLARNVHLFLQDLSISPVGSVLMKDRWMIKGLGLDG